MITYQSKLYIGCIDVPLKQETYWIYLRYNTPLSPIYWIGRKKRSKTLVKHRKKTIQFISLHYNP